MDWEKLRWLRLGDRYTTCRPQRSLRPPAEMEFAGRSRSLPGLPYRYSIPPVILQPGAANLGRRGRAVVSRLQSALVLWRVRRSPPQKVHGLLVLKTYILPLAKCLYRANDGVGAGGEQRKGRNTGELQLPLTRPRSTVIPTAQDGAQMVCKAHSIKRTHTTRFRCYIAWFTRCKKGGSSRSVS